MSRAACAGLILLLATAATAWAQRTITLPDSNGSGGAFTQPVGVTYPVIYGPVTRPTGLEFWFHAFWGDAQCPPGSLQYLVYINRADDIGRRIFWAGNVGTEHGTGQPISFPMSTWINPGETFVVASVNQCGAPAPGYLIVTIREPIVTDHD